MRRTKEDAELTRKLILDTALERFAARGIAECSLVEIAKHADLTRGAIYWHFKNKEEILEAIVTDFAAPLISMENAILDENEHDPLGKLRSMLVFLLRSIAEDETFRRVMVVCQRMRTLSFNENSNDTLPIDYMSNLTAQRRDRRVQVLRNAVNNGQLPQNTDCHAASNYILATIEGLAFSWVSDPNNFSLHAMAPTYIDAMLEGIKKITL